MRIFIFILYLVSFQAFAHYTGTVVKIIDGDTVKLDIAVWPGQTNRINVRLKGVDTPERMGKRNGLKIPDCEKALAKNAKSYVQNMLPIGKEVTVSGVKNGKYGGRVLGNIEINGKDMSGLLLNSGHGRLYSGGKRTGWCE